MKELKLEIRYRKLETIKPNDRNCRTHSQEQIEQIAQSINEFGFINPIAMLSDGTIIAGEGRYWAAKKSKLEKVPVIYVDHLSDTQRRAYLIADNKIALNAGWNLNLLAAELLVLGDAGFDVEVMGFSDEELKSLMSGLDVEEEQEKSDKPKSFSKPLCKSGDVWLLGEHQLVCGDNESGDADNVIDYWQRLTEKEAIDDVTGETYEDKKIGG